MGFFLFLLLNAALFLRPGEIVPALENAPIYEMPMLACLVVSLPQVVRQLTPGSLRSHPISACMVGLLGAVVMSTVLNAQSGEGLKACPAFAKLLIYYLLLVAVVDTPTKLRGFVYYLAGLIFVLTALALLQYHGVINIPALASYTEKQWEWFDAGSGGEVEVLVRLCAAGIYSNPNDLSRILAVGILISLCGWSDRRSPVPRVVWLALLGVFAYALALTHSRGGLLGLLGGLGALLCARYGGRKTIRLALLVLPVLLLAFGGRQTSMGTSGGTGFLRIMLWSDAFERWRGSLIFGEGAGDPRGDDLYPNTHNSFVQAYVGFGFVGGTLFLAMFYLSVLLPSRTSRQGSGLPEGELRRFGPYLIGIVASYIVGMLSSSRNWVAPSYMLAGLAAVYVRCAGVYLPSNLTGMTGRLVRHILLVSMLVIVALYLFVRILLAQAG